MQLERLKRESGEEISKMRGNAERSKEEAREAELGRLQAEEEAKKQAFRLSEQLEEMQKKQEIEVCGENLLKEIDTILNLTHL